MSAEARNLSEELFKLVDKNNSGKISKAEFATAYGTIAQVSSEHLPEFAKLNENRDGEVDRAEWSRRMGAVTQSRGSETFVAECFRILRAVRDAYGDGSMLHPWIDIDFSSLGQERRVIEGAENRGVTLPQLLKLMRFIASHADEVGNLRGWWDRRSKKPLHKDTITLYAVVDWIIKPFTAKQACSFVELVVDAGTTEQPPQWFISHWWGEAVRDFVLAVEAHVAARGLEESAAYWVCAYANNQHELGADIDADPRKTSFYKAMKHAIGVLLILDPNGTPFTRAWCCFEEAMVVKDETRTGAPLLLDIATVDSEKRAHVTTQGTTAADQKKYDELSNSGPRSLASMKVKREEGFPKAVLEQGFGVNTFLSEASVAIDRRRILNAICGFAADQLDAVVPQEGHTAFKAVDAALSALFAEAALRLGAREGKMEPIVEVLERDTAKRHARIEIPEASITSLAALAPAIRAWSELTHFELDATASKNLKQVAGLENLAQCSQLKVVQCKFINCFALSDVAALGQGLGALESLQYLRLKFSGCYNRCSGSGLSDIAALGQGIGALQSLQYLQLSFNQCTALSNVAALGQSVGALQCLQHLYLNFSGCEALRDVAALGQGIGAVQGLQHLELNFSMCRELSDVAALGQVVGALQCLQHLQLDFRNCNALRDVAPLGQRVGVLQGLQRFELNFIGCEELSDTLQDYFTEQGEFLAAVGR